MARCSTDSLIFDTLRLEGGLFVPAVLEKAARGEHTAQKAADYRLPKGLSLVDEQGRAFRIATALQKTFEPTRGRKDIDPARATIGFVTELLRDALGYSDLTLCTEPVTLADRAYPVTAFAAGERVPVIIAPHTLDLDQPDERFAVLGSGSRRRSAYQLAQQFLNASPGCTWAILTNGRQLRLVRDADTLTRPAFLEADLDLILRAQRYPDFAAVWRLFHASRAGAPDAGGDTYPWESWKKEGQEQGQRVREGLRTGVTDALLVLGTGFIEHPANEALRSRLQSGDLAVNDYLQQLFRLIYRFLFLFTVEERGLLHVPDDSPEARRAREAYAHGYAFRRLRDRALRRSGFDRYSDIWTSVRIVFAGLAGGQPRLALPALGGLFATTQCPDLDGAGLDNRVLLTAMRHLRWSASSGQLAAIDYRNMGPEELGSIYESLLELVPTVDLAARRFGFVGLTEAGSTTGNARKTTGSYYTPDCLVHELLDSALEPVIAQKIAAPAADPVAALLSLSVADISCGSGHFLLAAARRLAEKLAELRAVDGAVTPADYRHALREVIARCIYGVDRNPMALELARTALWLEGYEPGQPLSFLDHHLVCGDALLGLVNFQSLAAGIPANAFDHLAGDDKATCTALKKTNKTALAAFTQRRTQQDFFREADSRDLLAELRTLEALPETNPLEVEVKAATYTTFLRHSRDSRLAQAADLVVGAFLIPKPSATAATLCPTTQTLADLLYPRDAAPPPADVVDNARRLCREARVLHWPLAFAGVFARGGFDCVLGNPPWEVSQMGDGEYFSKTDASIAVLKGVARKKAIAQIREGAPERWSAFEKEKRTSEAANLFYHAIGRFPYTGDGKSNTYALFSETNAQIVNERGQSGFIVPTGIATDDSTKDFFAHLTATSRLASLYDFENRGGLFPAVDSRMKFCLLTLGAAETAELAFFLEHPSQLHNPSGRDRRFRLTPADFHLLNPNTRATPLCRSKADVELTQRIYRRVPILLTEACEGQPEQNPWGILIRRIFNMGMADVIALCTNQGGDDKEPMLEAKMLHQFDHRWSTYHRPAGATEPETREVTVAEKARPDFTVTPRYWIEERHVLSELARVPRCVSRAWDAQDLDALRAAFATWILAAEAEDILAGLRATPARSAREQVIATAGPLFDPLPPAKDQWFHESAVVEAKNWPPLTPDEIQIFRHADTLLVAAHAVLDCRSPRWLLSWRNITNATNERTVIASVLPRAGTDLSVRIALEIIDSPKTAAFLANINSLVFDYIARQKLGGTNLSDYIFKQLPVLAPSAYTEADLGYIVPRVLELTYTAHDLQPWAEDLGYTGGPFGYDPERRAQLRAELDAYYARLYGLTRDELRYILDPSDTHGADYPTVTFPGLKRNDESAHGEYRTRRLVLAAWDALASQ